MLDNEVARYDPDIADDRYGERPVERLLPVEGEGLVAALAWGTPKDAWLALVLSEERALTIPVSLRGLLVACQGDVLCEFVSLGDVSVQLRWSARSLKLATARVASPLTDDEWPRELERYGAGEPSAAVVMASFFELVGGLTRRTQRGD
ncbi:MAG TPA: hypothetical protein VFS43_32730 [Polyangiaceae bacterium]|nr:hypothetical protein [Polyangiaceae bacterium]